MNENHDQVKTGKDTEMLTIDEFAKRMKVARTTVFNWLKTDKFQSGRHYVQIGRVIRFIWPDLLEALSGESNEAVSAPLQKPRRRLKKTRGIAIDLDYI